MCSGGSAANFAVAISRLGLRSRFYGCVSNSKIGYELLEELKRDNVDVSYVQYSSRNPGIVLVILDSLGNKRMIYYPGANNDLPHYNIPQEIFNDVVHVHIAYYNLDFVCKILDICRRLNVSTSINFGGGIVREGLSRVSTLNTYKVNTIFLNYVELTKLTNQANVVSALHKLSRFLDNVDEIVVTLGSEGSIYFDNEDKFFVKVEAFRVENVVDTTGAGDTFAAAYIFSKLIGLEVNERLIFANAAAALKIMRKGARSTPTLSEVVKYLEGKCMSIAEKIKRLSLNTLK